MHIHRSKCVSVSPLYAPPEQFVDPEHPWAFDVFSIGLCVLRLGLRCLTTDEQLASFRDELRNSDGDLEKWLRTKLDATAVEPTLLSDLAAAFPPEAPSDGFALLCAMLRADPARRPSVDALLEHPFVSGGSGGGVVGSGEAPRWLDELLSGDSCEVTYYETIERPLAVRLRLKPPLGLLLGESDDGDGGSSGGLTVDGLVDDSAAAMSGNVLVGDRLVSIDGQSVRSLGLDDVSAIISSPRRLKGQAIELGFERDCNAEGATSAGQTWMPLQWRRRPRSLCQLEERRRVLGGNIRVLDAGLADSIGKRSRQEDASVLTSFTVAPLLAAGEKNEGEAASASSSYTLAACFDGHRGPRASRFGQSRLPEAVRKAVERGEPSPLAAGWRKVCELYGETGHQDGSCVSAALVAGDGRLELLNCGDCRAVLVSDVGVVELTSRDHSADDPLEMERISQMGGKVECGAGGIGRVMVESEQGTFQVAVARALGGSEWKGGGITDAAEVSTARLAPQHRFLVLCTDGVTGPLEDAGKSTFAERSAPIAWRVAAAVDAGCRAGDVAEGLVRDAIRRDGSDNASCVVLMFGE